MCPKAMPFQQAWLLIAHGRTSTGRPTFCSILACWALAKLYLRSHGRACLFTAGVPVQYACVHVPGHQQPFQAGRMLHPKRHAAQRADGRERAAVPGNQVSGTPAAGRPKQRLPYESDEGYAVAAQLQR